MEYQLRKRKTASGDLRISVVLEVWSDGKRSIISGGTFTTDKEAIRAGERLLTKYETDLQKTTVLMGKMTLNEWSEVWLESLHETVKPSTAIEYRRKMRNHVLPQLGSYRLSNLSSGVIRKWLLTLTLGHKTKTQCLNILKSCLTAAVKSDALMVNPAHGVGVERSRSLVLQEAEGDTIKIWDHEEAGKLLKETEGHKYLDAYVCLGLMCGLRPGEIGGVKWEDVDFLEGTVAVRRANRKASSTKSGASRVVPMPFEVVRRLVRLHEDRGGSHSPSGIWVLPVHHNTAAEHLKRFCALQGITVLTAHSMRHTFASMLISAGVPAPAVSKLLGHSSPAVTLNVYAHAMPRDRDVAMSVLEQSLGVAPPAVPTEDTPQIPTHLEP